MKRKKKEESADFKSKGEALVEFVLNRYNYSKSHMASRQDQWREYYEDYRGTAADNKEDWQANYVITSLKEAVRTKTPIYNNILFPADLAKSFDIEAGEENDEEAIPTLKDIIVYQLRNVGRDKGGLFAVGEAHTKQLEIYGYSLTKIPWMEDKEGIDIEVCDIFNAFPDPTTLDVNKSWMVIRKPDVFVSHLRKMEKKGIYHSVKDLKDTFRPGVDATEEGENKSNQDKVELLEYHGDIPKSLLEGKIYDEATVNPFEDDYIKALVVIANQKVCIRSEEYPYKYNGEPVNIFADAVKDKMPNEKFGCGTGEDIQSYVYELTNAHNKLSDCVNLIANPMAVVNSNKLPGLSGGVAISFPGKLWFTSQNCEDVNRAMAWMNTTAQAAALRPLIEFIRMLEDKIMKTTQAVPVISSMPSKEGLPDTLGATQMMQGNAAEPIKHTVKHCLEPWYQTVLEIIYKHIEQFFSKEAAYRVLGKERGALWVEEKKKRDIESKDIKLEGNPDFIPRGVSIFEEHQVELQNLLKLTEIAPMFMKPAYDPMGNPLPPGEDGKQPMQPVFDLEEIAKRVGEDMNFRNLEKLIPGLKEAREREEAKKAQKTTNKAGNSTPVSPNTGLGRGNPPAALNPSGNVPQINQGG